MSEPYNPPLNLGPISAEMGLDESYEDVTLVVTLKDGRQVEIWPDGTYQVFTPNSRDRYGSTQALIVESNFAGVI